MSGSLRRPMTRSSRHGTASPSARSRSRAALSTNRRSSRRPPDAQSSSGRRFARTTGSCGRGRAGTTAAVRGFLDDHALLGLGFLALYQAGAGTEWFVRARHLGDEILHRFVGPDGRMYQTADDAEQLVFRPRDIQDNATPSGASAAAELLALLSMFSGDDGYSEAAERIVRSIGDLLTKAPAAFGQLLSVADLLEGPPKEAAIVGSPDDPRARALAHEVTSRYLPNLVMALGFDEGVVPLLSDRVAIGGVPTAYLCERFSCQMPVTDPVAFRGQLNALTDRP